VCEVECVRGGVVETYPSALDAQRILIDCNDFRVGEDGQYGVGHIGDVASDK